MRVRARTSFGGQYAMYKGTACELPDNPVTRALIENGFLEEAPEEPEADHPLEEAPEEPKTDLHALRKEDIAKICKEKGVKVSSKATKDEMIAAIEAQE